MTGPDPEELLALAAETATATAAMLAEEGTRQRPEVVQTKSSLTDVVTAMDRRAEAMITERIRAVRPGDSILGEEGGENRGAGESGVRWIVDPLDGTVNYLYGLADWSVSIAAEVAGTVVAGVVAVPLPGETYLAVRGQGATVRTSSGQTTAAGRAGRATLRCNQGVPLAQALVGTGFGYLPAPRRAQGA